MIPPEPDGIASYTRTILFPYDTRRPWVEPATLDRFFDHFRSFGRLVISGLETDKFDAASAAHYFGHFAATVRSLELERVVGTPASLFSFICVFPLADGLAIKLPSLAGGSKNFKEVAHPVSVPNFRGKIRLLDMVSGSTPLWNRFALFPYDFTPYGFPLVGQGDCHN